MRADIERLCREQGIVAAAELRGAGVSDRRRAAAVAAGELVRLRRDRYCLPDLPAPIRTAVAAGGLAGCTTALRLAGVWVTSHDPTVHVQLAPHASRLPPRPRVIRHWDPLTRPASRTHVALLDALAVSMLCQRPLDAIATVDSALHLGLVSLAGLEPLCTDGRRRRLLRACDRRAESGLESILRVILRRLGLRVVPQARVPGVGRLDLLVEGVVVVEMDGRAYHSGPQRHDDHRRDAAAAAQGLVPLRFDPDQVHDQPESVVLAIVGALRLHRGVRFSGADARRVAERVQEVLSP